MAKSRKSKLSGGPLVESLEQRQLLSTVLAIGAATAITFNDASGDAVTVAITGSKGTATIEDSTGGTLVNGDNILSVALTGVSKDFVLSYADGNADSGDHVAMGQVTADGIITGVYTVAGPTGTAFELLSFTGPGFQRGGGMKVTEILGDTNENGLVLDALGKGVVINVSGDIDSGAAVVVNGNYDGAINVGGDWDGDLFVGGSVRQGAMVGAVGGDSTGEVEVDGDFAGTATISGDLTGEWTIHGNLTAKGTITAGGNFGDLQVDGNLNGTAGAGGTQFINVDGTIGKTAVIGGEDLFLEAGRMTGGRILGGNTLDLEVFGPVSNADIAADGALITIHGNVSKTNIVAGGNSVALGDITTNFPIGNGLLLEVDGNANRLVAHSEGDLDGFIDGNVTKSALLADGDLGLGLLDQNQSSAQYLTTTLSDSLAIGFVIGGDVDARTTIVSVGSMNLDVNGNLAGGVASSEDLQLEIGGSVLRAGKIGFGGDGVVKIDDDLDGLVGGPDLDLFVGGDVLKHGLIKADNILDLLPDEDLLGLFVGGDFFGRLDVITDLSSGTGGPTATIVQGDLEDGSVFNVLGSLGSAPTLTFGGNLEGTFNIGALDAFFTINGDVRQMSIGGPVNVPIQVDGHVGTLVTGSFFVPDDALTGHFVNGSGATTGTLTTGLGYTTVLPLAPLV